MEGELDWRAKVELYEQIRREYEFGVGSVIGVARKLGVHRRMVREAVRNAVPAQRKKTERPAVKMAVVGRAARDGQVDAGAFGQSGGEVVVPLPQLIVGDPCSHLHRRT